MKQIIPLPSSLFSPFGCSKSGRKASSQQINWKEARKVMNTQKVIILDVWEQDEYDSGHIPCAVQQR